jgi:class 3 adenylate cyclase
MSVTAGERRVVSVLVADIAASTSIAERIGPERSKFLFDEVVGLMRKEVERFGGTVAQLTGDGLLALFGAPTAHEDDSRRAVRAAVAIQEALVRPRRRGGPRLRDRAPRARRGQHRPVIPATDAPPHVLYNALGDTVNVAARLQSFGDLVVGPATARQVEESFELEELGDLELKGKSELVGAFRIVGVRESPPLRFEPPLVGREEELAALSEALEGLLEGRGAIVSITGEPGIGKSRLVAESRERFAERVRFLAGHAVPYAEAIPYWPVRDLLRDWLGLGVSDHEARVRLELRVALARTLGEEAEEAYPFLAGLLGVGLEPEQEQRIRDFAPDAVRGVHRSTTLASAGPSRTRSTAMGRLGPVGQSRQRPVDGSRRRCPATRTVLPRRTTRIVPARSFAKLAMSTEMPSARSCSRTWTCGRRRRATWPPSSRRSVFEFDPSAPPPTPSLKELSTRAPTTASSGE